MPDDAESEPSRPEPARRAKAPALRAWLERNRPLAMVLGCVALSGVIALDLYVMVASDERRGTPAPAKSIPAPSASAVPAAPQPAPVIDDAAREPSEGFEDATDDGEPPGKKPTPPRHFGTVQQAAAESCTTASVDGLSRQIIAQARCIKPNAFVPLPSRPNLVIASQVFPYLQKEAQTKLVQALDSKPNQRMTINSALRTVAQQYLVWRWSANKRCGVPLATPPGQSNHEIGIALDIAEHATWRPTLEAHDFRWLGASDRVHFDYNGRGGARRAATDVLAFQMLWNKNNPNDKIPEDGRYTPATEGKLKQAPPDGFRNGPSCGRSSPSGARLPTR